MLKCSCNRSSRKSAESALLVFGQQETLDQLARNFEHLTASQTGIPVDYVLATITFIGESASGTNSSAGFSLSTIYEQRHLYADKAKENCDTFV